MEGSIMKTIYLAYGSNLNLAQMRLRCPTAKPLGTAVLTDYQLLFRGGHGNAVATVEPKKGGQVPVLLWEIEPDDEKSLDIYEGYPYLYRKETVTVAYDGQEVSAMMYVMNRGRPLSTPNCYYYSTILEGYKDCGFDKAILKKAVIDSNT